MRKSTNDVVRLIFTNMLTKTGNLVAPKVDVATAEKNLPSAPETKRRASKWNAALVAEKHGEVILRLF